MIQTKIPQDIRNIFKEWADDIEAGAKKMGMVKMAEQDIGFWRGLALPAESTFLADDVEDFIRQHATRNLAVPMKDLQKEAKQVIEWLDKAKKEQSDG